MITAFAPINVMVGGGFLAVTYLKNRKTTEDLDYILDPEWAHDEDIKGPIRSAISEVAKQHKYFADWANEDAALFVADNSRKLLMDDAIKQNIVLWSGENVRILAAPVEWALERKLRRIYIAGRGRKAELDMSDAVAMLKFLCDKKGDKIDLEYYRTLNINGFDVLPDYETMQRVADEYKAKYDEDIFG